MKVLVLESGKEFQRAMRRAFPAVPIVGASSKAQEILWHSRIKREYDVFRCNFLHWDANFEQGRDSLLSTVALAMDLGVRVEIGIAGSLDDARKSLGRFYIWGYPLLQSPMIRIVSKVDPEGYFTVPGASFESELVSRERELAA